MLIWIKLYSCHPGEEVTPQSWPWSLTATERLQLLLASPVGPKAGQAHRLFIPTWHSSSLLCLKCFEWFGNTKDQFLKWFKFIGVPCLRCSQGWNGAEFEGGPLTWRAKKRLQTVLMCREWGSTGCVGNSSAQETGDRVVKQNTQSYWTSRWLHQGFWCWLDYGNSRSWKLSQQSVSDRKECTLRWLMLIGLKNLQSNVARLQAHACKSSNMGVSLSR